MSNLALLLVIMVMLVVFQVKHFLADFILQNKYMLGKFSSESRIWMPALSAHVAVHGMFTLVISSIFYLSAAAFDVTVNVPTISAFVGLLVIIDMGIHFLMDRYKASPRLGGKYPIDKSMFWYVLGIDQSVHHLTHYYIIFMLVASII